MVWHEKDDTLFMQHGWAACASSPAMLHE